MIILKIPCWLLWRLQAYARYSPSLLPKSWWSRGELDVHLQEDVSTTLGLHMVIYLSLAALGPHCFVEPFTTSGEWGLLPTGVLGFRLWWLHCCRAQALGAWASVVVAHRLSLCSSQALGQEVSGCVQGLSCSASCGIFPDQRLNLCPRLSRRILIHCTIREVLGQYIMSLCSQSRYKLPLVDKEMILVGTQKGH